MFGVRSVVRKIGGVLLGIDFILEIVDGSSLQEHLMSGDSRAAVVVSTTPLLVAAYSDDLDCVAMLQFPNDYSHRYRLSVGSKLLRINCYYCQFTEHADLSFGPGHTGQWTGFFPLIADFLSGDDRRIERLKQDIRDIEWQRCHQLGDEYLLERPGVARQGRPKRAHQPAGFLKKVVVGSTLGIVGIIAFVLLVWKFL
jgi:hypothetical protein